MGNLHESQIGYGRTEKARFGGPNVDNGMST